jgi:hypothetical protein
MPWLCKNVLTAADELERRFFTWAEKIPQYLGIEQQQIICCILQSHMIERHIRRNE